MMAELIEKRNKAVKGANENSSVLGRGLRKKRKVDLDSTDSEEETDIKKVSRFYLMVSSLLFT
jgi:hypothetical protein